MWDLFGLSAQQQAEREVGELNDTRSGLNNWDLGDRFRSALTGVSREDVTRRAGEIVAKKINQSNSAEEQYSRFKSGLTGFPFIDAIHSSSRLHSGEYPPH